MPAGESPCCFSCTAAIYLYSHLCPRLSPPLPPSVRLQRSGAITVEGTVNVTLANLTLINGLAVAGRVASATWVPADALAADVLEVRCEYEEVIWPWSG